MIGFILKYKYFIASAAFIAAISVSILFWGNSKYNEGIEKCEAEAAKVSIKSVEVRIKKDDEIIRLPESDIDMRLARWMRDKPKLLVGKADIPVS